MADPGIFVLGTDTEVGKTVVSAVLAGLLKRRNRPVAYLKPLGTGAKETGQGLASPDALFVAQRVGLEAPAEELCPITARPELSPAEALLQEGRSFDFEGLVSLCKERLAGPETLIVEGVGGLLVPLDEERLLIDLVIRLGLPALLVARPGLGTINHTLLTLSELNRGGVRVAGFLFSGPGQAEAARRNADWIVCFSQARYRGWLGPDLNSDWQKFLDQAEAALDLSGLPGFEE